MRRFHRLRLCGLAVGTRLLACSSQDELPSSRSVAASGSTGASGDTGAGSGGLGSLPSSGGASGGAGRAQSGAGSGATGAGSGPLAGERGNEAGGGAGGAGAMGGMPTGGTTAGGGAGRVASAGGAAFAGGGVSGAAGSAAGATAGGNAGSAGAGELVAFPGAEGFGRHAVGARGGAVYHVTTLADSGPGSFRDAISMPNRTVVFDVGGVIPTGERLIFSNHLTIAGQTAPGGGITIYGNGTSFTNAHHTIVRYLRFRMGIIGDSEKDTITIARGHDLIFDHCSISWGRDGNFDLNQESGYELGNITLQDSIVAQGLQTHSTGGLVNAAGVSVLRSLWIDNNSRNPKARQTLQWVNNIDYNWVASGYILGDTSGRSDGYMVGNYFITGPETNGGTLDSPTDAYHLFAAGNYYDNDEDGVLDGRLLTQGDFGTVTWETTPSVEFPKVKELTAQAAYDHVVANAGASRWRDEVDDYVVGELTSLGREGATISDEASLGLTNVVGDVPGGTAPPDTDQDGMPDAWESENGLDASDPEDRNADRNGDGWTNLEEYVNSLASP
jgi:pectate lyase